MNDESRKQDLKGLCYWGSDPVTRYFSHTEMQDMDRHELGRYIDRLVARCVQADRADDRGKLMAKSLHELLQETA